MEWPVTCAAHVGPGTDAVQAGYVAEADLRQGAEWATNSLAFAAMLNMIAVGRRPFEPSPCSP
jgi:hypothetical protein